MSRLSSLSQNPTLRNFARDASQKAVRRVASFISPLVQVPDVTGFYKVYNSKNRYKRPRTRKTAGDPATRLGFSVDDPTYNLVAHALDFPIPSINGMSDETLMYHAQYGTQLLADASALDHEAETIGKALELAGAGTDSNFTSDAVDPIDVIDGYIMDVMKLAKNGAGIKVLFGATALKRTKNNKNVKGRYVSSGKGSGIISPTLADIASMLFGNPTVDAAFYVEDTAVEGKAEAIDFLLDDEILIFASNDTPNTMDPSFLKTFVPMKGWMLPGSYRTQDDRDEVLKMDWTMQIVESNPEAVKRVNAKAA